jgi:hypothetical protein
LGVDLSILDGWDFRKSSIQFHIPANAKTRADFTTGSEMRLSTAIILFLLCQWSVHVTGFKPLEEWTNQMAQLRSWAEQN